MKAKSARRTASVANGAARTIGGVSYRVGRARGRLDSKPRVVPALALFAAGLAAGATAVLLLGREPATTGQ